MSLFYQKFQNVLTFTALLKQEGVLNLCAYKNEMKYKKRGKLYNCIKRGVLVLNLK